MGASRSKAARHLAKEKARGLITFTQTPEDLRAQDDFPFFCEWVTRNTGKALVQPEHMQLWNELIITGEDTNDLHWIAGPNLDLLAPRGSAKSTYLGLLLAWLIGKHTIAGIHLPVLYISYNVEIARAKSSAIKRVIESEEYLSLIHI
jgi:hypothetical protein